MESVKLRSNTTIVSDIVSDIVTVVAAPREGGLAPPPPLTHTKRINFISWSIVIVFLGYGVW
eukprot:SAG11_NODE_18729_length_479_cov_27.182768_1_plen_61_part_01